MKVFFQIAYFVIGLVQLIAVWDGAEYFLGTDSFFGKMIAFFFALFVSYIPLLGSGLGVYGAVNVWDWSLTKSVVLFFWYVPFFLLFFGYSLITERR